MKQRIAFVFFALVLTEALLCGNFAAAQNWEALENCQVIKAGGNHGDTFNVQHEGKSYWFHLYYVESPEESGGSSERVKKDTEYFNLDEKETFELAKKSEIFALKFLAGRTFTLRTCWEEVASTGSGTHYYALVEKDSRSLIEALTEAGLVRIQGTPTPGQDSPLHVDPAHYRSKLKRLEDGAKRERVGGWSQLPEIKPAEPAPSSAPILAPAAVVPQEKTAVVPALPPSVPLKTININTATQAEIEAIPGIGPVLAQRMMQRRPYQAPEDLQRVQGIGAKTAEKILPYVRFKD